MLPRNSLSVIAFVLVTTPCIPVANAQDPPFIPTCYDGLAVPTECFPDASCPQFSNYSDYRRSVVQIYGPDIAGSGFLMNNAYCEAPFEGDSDCGIPYVLTAAHVVTGDEDGAELNDGHINDIEDWSTFTLGFEATFCGSDEYAYELALGGSQVLDSSGNLDLLLLQLNTAIPPEAGPYYLGWGQDGFDEAAAMGHPCGGPRKIALADAGDVTAFWDAARVRYLQIVDFWEYGSVTLGSSGGPLVADSGRLLGVLVGIKGVPASCYQMEARSVALPTIIPFTGTYIANALDYHEAFDSNALYFPIPDVEVNDQYYGEGSVVEIMGKFEVRLSDGFHAAHGSTVHVFTPIGMMDP